MSYNANYPVSADALANPTSVTNRDDVGFELHGVISRIQDILEALEANADIAALAIRGAVDGASGRIAAGSLTTADLAAGSCSQGFVATPIPTAPGAVSTTATWFDFPDGTIAVSNVTTGSLCLAMFSAQVSHSVANGRCQFRVVAKPSNAVLCAPSGYVGAALANQDIEHVGARYFVAPAGATGVALQIYLLDAGVLSIIQQQSYFAVVELRR
jgi:hypothetical protein